MPIPFTCPHCGHSTTVDDQYAGQSGPCAACGQTIMVPGASLPGMEVGAPPPRPAYPNYPAGPQPRKSSSSTPVIVICVVVGLVFCSGILVALLLPAVQSAREAARGVQCNSNMKQLALGMHNYHDTYKLFPPASFDQDGEDENEISLDELVNGDEATPGPQNWSWRVRILPFLAESYLYEQFNFDEPWDSDHNLMVAHEILPIFQCPSDIPDYKEVNGYMIPVTSYVMVSGPDAVGSTDGREVQMADITDGLSNTLMIVEVTGENRPAWTEPVDITIEDLQRGINSEFGRSPGSIHPGGMNAAFCDGSVQFLSETMDSETLGFLGQIDDGQIVYW